MANEKYLDESIASATTGTGVLQARNVAQKGSPLYALVHVYGAGTAGAFTGSVQVEVSPPGRGTYALAGTAMTTAGSQALCIPADADYRFNVTALSANGPISVFMALPA